jgi:hypothetical protein
LVSSLLDRPFVLGIVLVSIGSSSSSIRNSFGSHNAEVMSLTEAQLRIRSENRCGLAIRLVTTVRQSVKQHICQLLASGGRSVKRAWSLQAATISAAALLLRSMKKRRNRELAQNSSQEGGRRTVSRVARG